MSNKLKKIFILIVLIFSFLLASCKNDKVPSTIIVKSTTQNNEKESIDINIDSDFNDFFSVSNYYLLDNELYTTYGKERIINDSSITYLDSVFLNDTILKLEITTNSLYYKPEYGDILTLEIEYENVDLDLEQAKTTLYQKSKNIVELYYPYSENIGTTTEYIYLTIKVTGNGYIKISALDNIIFTIDFTNICDYEYKVLDNNELSITKYLGNDTNIVIPNSIGDYTFTRIEENAFNNINIKTISIPSTISYIEKDAFSNCTNLEYNTLDGLDYLGNDDNKYLVLVKARDKTKCEYDISSSTIVIIDNEIFNDCINIEKLTINNTSLNDYNLYFPSEKIGYNFDGISKEVSNEITIYYISWSIIHYNITYNLDGGINDSSNPTTYTIEDEITLNAPTKEGYSCSPWSDNGIINKGSTGDKEFTIFWSIIHYNITYNLDGGINDSSNPTTYTIEDEITLNAPTKEDHFFIGWYLNDKLFKSDTLLRTDITLTAKWKDKNITTEEEGTEGLEYKLLENGTYEVFVGKCTECPIIVIPNEYNNIAITSIGSEAFYNCSFLISITIPEFVTSIKDNIFYGCHKLVEIINKSSINITKGSEKDGYYALNIKTSGESDIKILNDFLFYTYNNINYLMGYVGSDKELVLPEEYNNSIYEIYSRAFYNLSFLTSVTIPEGVASIGNYSPIGTHAFENCSSLKTVTILANLSTINSYAFKGCSSLISINIPGSITSISGYAFYGCSSLSSITIPSSVTFIGASAFKECYRLVEVINKSSLKIAKVSNSNGYVGYYALDIKTSGESEIVNVNDYLFYTYENVNYLVGYIGDDKDLVLPDKYNNNNYVIYQYSFAYTSLTSITIPEGVTSIGKYAFYNCSSLSSITILEGITLIECRAFNNCPSLTDVYYASTEEEWKKIIIVAYNDSLSSATIHYNYEKAN